MLRRNKAYVRAGNRLSTTQLFIPFPGYCAKRGMPTPAVEVHERNFGTSYIIF
jgi:hypothetical protein